MTLERPDRRTVLAQSLSLGAFFLLPEMARAQAEAIASGIALGPAEPFSFERLREAAQGLAHETFTPMAKPEAAILDQIDYDAHGRIRFRPERKL